MASTSAGLTSTMPTTAETGGTNTPPGGVNPGVIAAAVIVPLAVIAIVVGALVFYWYRKKYPMRGALGKVALGRDASKYQNPMYMTPKEGRNHTLIRNTGNVHGQDNLAFDGESHTKSEEPVNKPSLTKPADAPERKEDLSDTAESTTLKKDLPSVDKQRADNEVVKEMLKQEEKSDNTETPAAKPADSKAGAPVSEVKESNVPRSARSLKRASGHLGVTVKQTSEGANGGITKPQRNLERLKSYSRDYSIDDIESILSEDEVKEKPGPGTAGDGSGDSGRRSGGQSPQAVSPTSDGVRVQQSLKSAKPALTRQQATDNGDNEKSKTGGAVRDSDSTRASTFDISRDSAVKDKKPVNMTHTPAAKQGTGGKKDTPPSSKSSQSVSTNQAKPKPSSTGESVNAQSKTIANSPGDDYDDKLNPFGSD